MRKETAKKLGYEVIDEFGFNIANRVWVELKDGKVVSVMDELGSDIKNIVKVFFNGLRIKNI